MSNQEVLIVGNEELFKQRCLELPYSLSFINSFENFDIDRNYDFKFVIMDGRKCNNSELSGSAQVASQVAPSSKFILIVGNRLPVEDIKFLYQSGANLILSESEFFQNQKLTFFITHYLNNSFIPVKSFDFEVNTNPDFKVYHLISFKGTFVPIFFGEITPDKLKKVQAINELYIKREDLNNFSNYLNLTPKQSGDKLLSRCRIKYLEFYEEFIKLIFTLTDNSKTYTFDEGRQLLAKIQNLSADFLSTLSFVEDPWLVVNNLCLNSNLNSLARTPAVAAYAGMTAFELNLPNPEEVMLSCLLSDIGLLDLPHNGSEPYDEKNKTIYFNHPLKSINLILERRVPLPENIKQIILYTHENLSGSGFPKGEFNYSRFPIESQIIQICQMLDEKLVIKPGVLRPNISEVKIDLINILSDTYLFDMSLILKIKNNWLQSNQKRSA